MSEDQSVTPTGWVRTTLGVIGNYLNGRAFKKEEWSTSGRVIIRIQDLTGTGGAPNYFRGAVEPRYLVSAGDLLISWAATLGAYVWRGSDSVLNQHIFKVESFIDRRFHYHLAVSIINDLYRQAHGSGMVHITKGRFENTSILLPPVQEQERIVEVIEAELSRVEAAVTALKRVKANLKRYRAAVLKAACEGRLVPTEAELARCDGRELESAESMLDRLLHERFETWKTTESQRLQALGKHSGSEQLLRRYAKPAPPVIVEMPSLPEGWSWASLDQLSWTADYGTSQKCEYLGLGQPVLRIPNIVDGSITFDDLKFATKPDELAPQDAVRRGDFLIIRTNGSENLIGRAAAVQRTPDRDVFFASYLIRFRIIGDPILLDWVNIWWQSPRIRQWLVSQAASSAGQYNLSLSKLTGHAIAIPPRAEMERIVAEVRRRMLFIARAMSQTDVNERRAERLRQSILKRAFEGKLVPQDPSDEPASVLLERIHAERGEQAPTRRKRRSAAAAD